MKGTNMTIEKLNVKTITTQQFQQMVQIEQNCGLEPYSPDMLHECIEALDTFGCFDGEKIVGFVTVNPKSRMWGGSLYIVNINVAHSCRGRGIAKRMLLAVYQYYILDGIKWVILDVAKKNRAMELYRRIGFQIQNIPSRNGETDVVMAMPFEQMGENLRRLL